MILALLFLACATPDGEGDHAPEAHDHAAHDHAAHDHADAQDHADAHDHDHDGDDHEAHPHAAGLRHLRLTPETASMIAVERGPLVSTPWAPTLRAPAQTAVPVDREAVISGAAAVRVVSLAHPEHASVAPGALLAELELVDPEVRALQMRAVEVRADRLQLRTELERNRAYLAALPPGEERRRVEGDTKVLEARTSTAESALAAILDGLKVAGLSAAQIEALHARGQVSSTVSVYAPRQKGVTAWEIRDVSVRAGESAPAGAPLMKLVSLDSLLVVGEALESDVETVRAAAREGWPASIRSPGGGPRAEGLHIHAVEGVLHDPTARITRFFVHLPNQVRSEHRDGDSTYADWEFRAGAQVEVLISTGAPRAAWVLPWEAVVQEGSGGFVFREEKNGDFVRIPVRMAATEADQVVVESADLRAGDTLAMRGATSLHLLLSGGAVDPHFGHSH